MRAENTEGIEASQAWHGGRAGTRGGGVVGVPDRSQGLRATHAQRFMIFAFRHTALRLLSNSIC